MRRALMAVATVVVVLPVLAFAIILWFNWGQPPVVSATDPTTLGLLLPGGRQMRANLSELLAYSMLFGVVIGLLATALTFAAKSTAWRTVMAKQTRDNQKLAAANRALEGALPVLREGYDRALGALDAAAAPPLVTPVPATTPVGAETSDGPDRSTGVDARQLALEDQRERRNKRRRRSG